MSRDIHDYDSLKKAYDVLLMFERFPGPVRSERVEEFVTQLKRDIREYIHRDSDYTFKKHCENCNHNDDNCNLFLYRT